MPHTTPNIPTSQPDNRKTSTINETMKAAKGNANNSYGPGIAANSTSSGNSVGVEGTQVNHSFWAIITRRLRYFSTPTASWNRIPHSDKPKKRLSVYDLEEVAKETLQDNYEYPKTTFVKDFKYFRNPWISYDGFVHSKNVQEVDEFGNVSYRYDAAKHFYAGRLATGRGTSDEAPYGRFYPDNSTTGFFGLAGNEYYVKGAEYRYVGQSAKSLQPLNSQGTGTGTSNSFVPKFDFYTGSCPPYFWCYGWAELTHDIDLQRAGSWFFKFPTRNNTRPWEYDSLLPPHGGLVFQEGEPPPEPAITLYNCQELNVPPMYTSIGGIYGNAMGPLTAHEVNNICTRTGSIVRMSKGEKDYYLFTDVSNPRGDKGVNTYGRPNAPKLLTGESNGLSRYY